MSAHPSQDSRPRSPEANEFDATKAIQPKWSFAAPHAAPIRQRAAKSSRPRQFRGTGAATLTEMIRPDQDAHSAATDAAGTHAPSRLAGFRAGLRSHPALADHGFHGMAVLPGAFLIRIAEKTHGGAASGAPVIFSRIEFERPVFLSDGDTPITARITPQNDGSTVCEFFEAAADGVENSGAAQPCARLHIEAADQQPSAGAPHDAMRTFLSAVPDSENKNTGQNPITPNGSAADFYRHLRANGNEYGPHFQTLDNIRRDGTQIVAEINSTADHESGALLDAAAQLLSAFTLDLGRTFILKSIARLVLRADTGTRPTHAIATRESPDGPVLIGSVTFTDAHGTPLIEFSGVHLAFIDPPAAAETNSANALPICIASTFTAEPLEESLQFWSEHFGRKSRVEFAPYNQVFQQLLDPASAFRRNRDGVNILVLGLDDWLHGDRRTLPVPDPAHFGARPRHTLPDGFEIVHLNRHETEYVWQEIFEDESYLRHGIELTDGATVIDIGANIGLFSLFVLSRCKNPTIFSFEPSPRVFDLLRANCAAYGGGRVHAFNIGVAEKRGSAQFTFYENSSVFSGFHPDESEDRAAVRTVARNVLESELRDSTLKCGDALLNDADIEEITAHRLDAQTIECPLTSVSDIIRDNGITRIHLLKIDAEKSELGILRGIAEEHWPLIEQLVIEVHDRTRAAVQSVEEMLTRRGFHCAVVEEKLLEHSGLFNIYARRTAPAAADKKSEGLRSKVTEFCSALDTFAAAAGNPFILALAPRIAGADAAALDAAESEILSRAARHPHIRCIRSLDILARHPVRELHDAHSRSLGHMPFTPEGYAAIGTAISRAIFSTTAPQVKVIALDCDNTLWQGLAAEDGPGGIALTPPFKRLQEFMVAQSKAGVLLTLCSKNQEADVVAVFDQRDDMPLRREHLAGWRINWASKPDNLRALAGQFNVGLDAFVFLDDNPVECAAVRAACPEVITLQLPQQPGRIPAFLDSLWILDRAAATKEDRERSEWYRANTGREELRTAAPTLRDFLDSLQIRIETAEATEDQIARIAQLTLRTNQFNLTTVRRSESELRDFLNSGAQCLVTTVSDRFGDYGLVGATLHTVAADRFVVDTMLLSCRALGKGVELHMLATLAGRAMREGKSHIELSYRRTARNEPARNFLAQLGAVPEAADFTLTLPAASLASLRYEPAEQAPAAPAKTLHGAQENAAARGTTDDHTKLSAALQRVGDELSSIESIVAAMDTARLRTQPANTAPIPEFPGTGGTLEQSLAGIWKKVLGRTHIGANESFFDAGGTSLKAVVVVATIRRELNRSVSIITLFECPTIALLAARLEGSDARPNESPAAAADAESRGKQRRNKLIKRKIA